MPTTDDIAYNQGYNDGFRGGTPTSKNGAYLTGYEDGKGDRELQDFEESRTGRGPSGKLRNFRAMQDPKLRDTWDTVRLENNDTEARDELFLVMVARGLLTYDDRDWEI